MLSNDSKLVLQGHSDQILSSPLSPSGHKTEVNSFERWHSLLMGHSVVTVTIYHFFDHLPPKFYQIQSVLWFQVDTTVESDEIP